MEDINCWQTKFKACEYSNKLIALLTTLNKEADEKVDINEVKKAIYYARKYHGNQLRKSGHPYYYHPIEVSLLYSRYVGTRIAQYYTTNLIVSAILHDTIEDTSMTKNMIDTIFGPVVASQVEDLTRIKKGVKITAGDSLDLLYSEGKEDILCLKIFDRLHNMQTIASTSIEKQRKVTFETKARFIPYAIRLKLHEVAQELTHICAQII
jgi:(p)ppGpp synthase/HD superfamily hydrolase